MKTVSFLCGVLTSLAISPLFAIPSPSKCIPDKVCNQLSKDFFEKNMTYDDHRYPVLKPLADDIKACFNEIYDSALSDSEVQEWYKQSLEESKKMDQSTHEDDKAYHQKKLNHTIDIWAMKMYNFFKTGYMECTIASSRSKPNPTEVIRRQAMIQYFRLIIKERFKPSPSSESK